LALSKAELKDIQILLSKKGRKEHGLFLAEGVRLLEEAFRHKFPPQQLIICEDVINDRGKALVSRGYDLKIPVTAVPAKQFESLTDTENPQGLVGVFRLPSSCLDKLFHPNYRKLLVCEDISDPGNLGTLIRSAVAFEFDLIILIGTTAEPFSPKVVRSTAGAVFGAKIAQTTWVEVKELIHHFRIGIIGTDIHGVDSMRKMITVASKGPFMLAIGSESRGLTTEILDQSKVRVHIDHSENVESLNAAVAGSILMRELYESERKREKR
jgi:RNA methyltransferase, TrmH family